MACVCTFIHAIDTEDENTLKKKKERRKRARGKLVKQCYSVDEWYRPAHFMDGLFCQ